MKSFCISVCSELVVAFGARNVTQDEVLLFLIKHITVEGEANLHSDILMKCTKN